MFIRATKARQPVESVLTAVGLLSVAPFPRGRHSMTCTYTFYTHSLADNVARSQAVHLCANV